MPDGVEQRTGVKLREDVTMANDGKGVKRPCGATGQAESTLVPTSNPTIQTLQSLMCVPVLQVNYSGRLQTSALRRSQRLVEIKEQPKSVREKERGLHVRGRDCSLSACAHSLRVSEQACTSARARVRLFALRVRVQSVCKREREVAFARARTRLFALRVCVQSVVRVREKPLHRRGRDCSPSACACSR